MKKIFGLSKLNVIAIVLVACVAIIATAGGSIAYFSDNKQMTNTFTMGNVYISLSEAKMVEDATGNRVPDPNGARLEGTAIGESGATNEYGSLYPGKQMLKDPTIKNTGSEPAYIAAKIIVKANGNIGSIYGGAFGLVGTGGGMFEGALFDEATTLDPDAGIRECAKYTMRQSVEADGSLVLYVFVTDALKPTDAAITLFDTMCIDPEFDNAAMQQLAGLTVTVQAFAVQTYGFADCYEAMTKGFVDHFDFD